MRLSSLVVASILLVSTSLLAQHSVTSSTPSSSSGSSSSHASSPSVSTSHGSASSASSSAHSASVHSSNASVPHSSSTRSAATDSRTQSSRSGHAKAIREPTKTAKEEHGAAKRSKNTQLEHKRVFAFLHRHRKPTPKELPQPVEAELRHRVCPPGQSVDNKGGCIASATTTTALTQCPPNAYGVRAGSCANQTDKCASFRGQLDAAAAELRSINAEMRNAGCSGASPTQECGFLGQRRDAAVARYRSVQGGIPAICPGTFPDPFSL
jgi:hypothetical protein